MFLFMGFCPEAWLNTPDQCSLREQKPQGSGAGAAVGGIAGSSVGAGKGKAIATVLGAVAGGVAGAAISHRRDGDKTPGTGNNSTSG